MPSSAENGHNPPRETSPTYDSEPLENNGHPTITNGSENGHNPTPEVSLSFDIMSWIRSNYPTITNEPEARLFLHAVVEQQLLSQPENQAFNHVIQEVTRNISPRYPHLTGEILSDSGYRLF